MSVRQATIGDLALIAPLFDAYRQFYGQPPDPVAAKAFLLERFRHQQSVMFLAVDDQGQPTGFTQLYPSFSSVRMARSYILNDMFVATSARRQGVAAALLQAAAAYGRAMGAARLSLATGLDNKDAQALYESQGWRADEVFRHYNLSL